MEQLCWINAVFWATSPSVNSAKSRPFLRPEGGNSQVTTTGTPLAGKSVVGVTAGTSHCLAWCADGTLVAWGKNDLGQLGDSTTTQRSLAVAVDVTALAPGERLVRAGSGSNAHHSVAQVAAGMTAQEYWRQAYFGDFSNNNGGYDLNDFDQDGILNLVEYAFGLNPTRNSAGQLPQAQRIANNWVITFTQSTGVSGVTYAAEWSATLQASDWHSIPDTGSGNQHVFSMPVDTNSALFTRLRVTNP